MRLFTIWYIVPVYNDLDQKTVCPNGRIRTVNMQFSILNAAVCGSTLFLLCPHTVGVECLE
ncbi:Bor family protein [Leptospira semungkisensis]|uniref:Bor family protein n=1 Tax=Leptospira semungkisensis TaxID=2484985 RepID=UPI001FE3C140|nr:Bor family protein [Leptospira semungkisensis]